MFSILLIVLFCLVSGQIVPTKHGVAVKFSDGHWVELAVAGVFIF